MLMTDVWANPRWRKFLPQRWKQRFHDDFRATVVSWTAGAAIHELFGRCRGRRTSWDIMIQRNRWFQKIAVRRLRRVLSQHRGPRPVVFAYSYAARDILDCAKSLGCPTVLGQIDPGPVEERIVQQVEFKHKSGGFDAAPPSYWAHWKDECETADLIIVNSKWAKDALVQEGVSEKKLRTVGLAYDGSAIPVQAFSRSATSSQKLKILFLGQLIPRKGICELAAAIESLRELPVEWYLVGGGPPDILARLRELPNTTVPGAVTRHDAARYYQMADVFILPTHSDGFALTQLEAQSYGLPIIASRFCGAVVDHERTGYILDQVTSNDIGDIVKKLVQTPGTVAEWRRMAMKQPTRRLQDLATDLNQINFELRLLAEKMDA